VLRWFRRIVAGGTLAGLAVLGLRVLCAGRLRSQDPSREHEERFRLHADNARDLVYRLRFHPTPGFEYVSPSSTAMTGYSPEEHYADPDLGFKRVHPEDRHLLENSMRSSDEPLILRWYRKDGV
jgi:PAS domain-containing protein